MTESIRTLAASALIIVVGSACSAPTPGIARGEAVFDTCASCHGDAGEGNRELEAPAIAGLPQWYVEGQLQAFMEGWRGDHPLDTVGLRMKSMSLSLDTEGDAASVAEYVASLPRVSTPATLPAGDVEAGREVYEGFCIACHGADGEGLEALHAPPLKGQPDWYMARQIEKFRMGWRGAVEGDIWGASMRVNTELYDDTQMLNALAYVRTLQ